MRLIPQRHLIGKSGELRPDTGNNIVFFCALAYLQGGISLKGTE